MAATQTSSDALTVVEKKTFCGICEASCGLIATVEDDRVVSIRPDPEHPSSKGFACSKGVEFHEIADDPDRVVHPMRRLPDGSFARATWDEAFEDIGASLNRIRKTYGADAIGVAFGNPVAWNFSGGIAISGLAAVLGTKHHYASTSVDINNYFAAGDMLYGSTMSNTLPDFAETDFALLVGTNPVVSHGSMATTGRIREVLAGLKARGGTVVVVDPRRTETARMFNHVPIRPGADPWLLGAMLRVLFDEDLIDWATVRARLPCPATRAGDFPKVLEGRQPARVNREHWQRIDEHELTRGLSQDRPRRKLTDRDHMLRVAGLI